MTTFNFPITIVVQANGDTTVTGYTAPAAPVNTTLPTSSGTPQVGVPFTFTRGVWSNSPTSYTEQVNAAGVAISGATSLTYTPVAADVGKALTLTENATNGTLGVAVTSNPTPAVIASSGRTAFSWSTTDKAAGAAISNSNHTVTHSGADSIACVRGAASKTSGAWHLEVNAAHVKSAGAQTTGIGLADSSQSLTAWPGGNAHALLWYDDGSVWFNGTQVATWDSFVSTNDLVFEFNEGTKLAWGKNRTTNPNQWNKNATANPGTATGGVSFAALTAAVFPIALVYSGTDAFIASVPTQTNSSGFSDL